MVLDLLKEVQALDQIFYCQWEVDKMQVRTFLHVYQVVDPKDHSSQKILIKLPILHTHLLATDLNYRIHLVDIFYQKSEALILRIFQKLGGLVSNLTVEECILRITTKLKSKLVVFSAVVSNQTSKIKEVSSILQQLAVQNNQLPKTNHQIDHKQTMVQ